MSIPCFSVRYYGRQECHREDFDHGRGRPGGRHQFTNRNFRSDRHADPATGAVLTILDQILVSANKKRESSKRITYLDMPMTIFLVDLFFGFV